MPSVKRENIKLINYETEKNVLEKMNKAPPVRTSPTNYTDNCVSVWRNLVQFVGLVFLDRAIILYSGSNTAYNI